jgi:anti-sigma factor RsiW
MKNEEPGRRKEPPMSEETRPDLACEHAASQDLFLFVRHQLAEDTRRELEHHLAECESCRERESTLRWIQEQVRTWGGSLFADHVASEALVRYSEARDRLPAELEREINRHLTLCEACAADLRMVEQVGRTLEDDALSRQPGAVRAAASQKPGLLARVVEWLRAGAHPAPAWTYVILVVLAVPAAFGIRGLLRPSTEATATGVTALPSPQVLEAQDQRGASAPQVVIASSGEPVLLEIHVPVLETSGARYEARLFSSSGREIWHQDRMESTDAFGTFLLLIDPHRLEAGVHRLVVRERVTGPAPIGGGGVSDFEFVFDLRLH